MFNIDRILPRTTIQIDQETLSTLRRVKGDIQSKTDNEVTFDDVLQELISDYKKRHK